MDTYDLVSNCTSSAHEWEIPDFVKSGMLVSLMGTLLGCSTWLLSYAVRRFSALLYPVIEIFNTSHVTYCAVELYVSKLLGSDTRNARGCFEVKEAGHVSHQTTNRSLLRDLVFAPRTNDVNFVQHDGRWVSVSTDFEQHRDRFRRRITLCSFLADKAFFMGFIDQAFATLEEHQDRMTKLFVMTEQGSSLYWEEGVLTPSRPLATIMLRDDISNRLLLDMKTFVDNESWYIKRGIPYRRGYLLHGPPGCGKTSFILAVAGHFHLPVYIISLTTKALTDMKLTSLVRSIPEKSIILMEDVIFPSKETAYCSSTTGVSYATLLNLFDGAMGHSGTILFLTTNDKPDSTNPLLRPGRVDVMQYIGYPERAELAAHFRFFFQGCAVPEPHDLVALSEKYAARVHPPGTHPQVSLARAQSVLMLHRDDPVTIASNCRFVPV